MLVTGEATGSFRFAFSPSKLDSCPAKIRNIAVKIAQKQQINAIADKNLAMQLLFQRCEKQSFRPVLKMYAINKCRTSASLWQKNKDSADSQSVMSTCTHRAGKSDGRLLMATYPGFALCFDAVVL